jgi:hypothetical protein
MKSTISLAVTKMSVIESLVLLSKGGTGIFSSSNLDTKLKNVYYYLVRNKLIYEYLSGFLPKHFTIHQLLELYNSILNSLEKKEFSCFLQRYRTVI